MPVLVGLMTVCIVLAVIWAIRMRMADFYDIVIIRMTRVWYRAVLDRCDVGERMLDVGIGTATALIKNKALLMQKRISVVGVDYEEAYVKKAETVIANAGLSKEVKVHCRSIYDPNLLADVGGGIKFDCAYFSGSLTLMPDPPAALRCAASMLTDNGVVYVTQTFQNQPSPLTERVKPMLHRLTSIDFGRVTYAEEIAQIAAKAGMTIVADAPVPDSINNPTQTARMIVLRPGASKVRPQDWWTH